MASRDHAQSTSARTEVEPLAPNPISPEMAAAPFLDGGLGDLMLRAGEAYLADYVMGQDEGPDHEPTEFERWLLEDFLNGLMNDEAMFGPVRRVLLQASAAKGLFDALKRNRAALDLIDPMRPLQYATTMDLMRRDMDAAIAKALGREAASPASGPIQTLDDPIPPSTQPDGDDR